MASQKVQADLSIRRRQTLRSHNFQVVSKSTHQNTHKQPMLYNQPPRLGYGNRACSLVDRRCLIKGRHSLYAHIGHSLARLPHLSLLHWNHLLPFPACFVSGTAARARPERLSLRQSQRRDLSSRRCSRRWRRRRSRGRQRALSTRRTVRGASARSS